MGVLYMHTKITHHNKGAMVARAGAYKILHAQINTT